LNIENLTKIIKNKNIRGGGWAMKEVGKKVKKKIKEKIRKKASESLFVSMALIMWSSLVINLKLLWTKIKLIFTRTRRVLLVNRGVIAWSILMTCTTLKLLGIKIKLVIPYTEEDDGRPYLSLAEKLGHKKVFIGKEKTGNPSIYMDIRRIVKVGKKYRCKWVHLGTGLGSENWRIIKAFEEAGIQNIGATWKQVQDACNKIFAIETAQKIGIPVKPGSHRVLKDVIDALAIARIIGYPVMLKPVNGGGGKGIVICFTPEELIKQFENASEKAKRFFGNGEMYLEKYFKNIRHVEVQVYGYKKGKKHFARSGGVRGCTAQTNKQKEVEESPAPWMTENQQRQMEEWAVLIVKEMGIVGLCTVEFVIDCETGEIYFGEINVRIQVEHAITGIRYGINLILLQFRIAFGLPVENILDKLKPDGYTLETRVCAKSFNPKTGHWVASPDSKITQFLAPKGEGIFVYPGVGKGSVFTNHYDSLICLVVVKGKTREECIEKMRRALLQFEIEGVGTNIPFLLSILNHPEFIEGSYDSSITKKVKNYLVAKEKLWEKRLRHIERMENNMSYGNEC
jgi:acetyl/propionyl-CoA carboxylase alpha subunit